MQVIDFQVKVSKNKGVRGTLVLSKKPAAAAPTLTAICTSENSSDLGRAPGARSIAEEKSGVTILVIELHWSQGSEHFRSPAVFLGILPRDAVTNVNNSRN